MANDHSVVIVSPVETLGHCNEMLAAYFGDDPGSENLSVPASASGQAPATHKLCHLYRNNESAAELAAMPTGGGTLPAGLNLSGYNVTTQEAQAAAAAISRVSVKTGAVSPASHVDDIMTDLGLALIQ